MTRKIIQNFIIFLIILSFFYVYGCATALIGTGAAAGGVTYSYFTGKLTKTYESEYHETVEAGWNTLEKLEIPITETIADGLKTEFKAIRADETPVAIEIVRIDREYTEVSVRTGSVGIWDRRVSEQIHGYISEALEQKIADDEKSLDESAKADAQPTIGEVVHPQIVEEDLKILPLRKTSLPNSTPIRVFKHKGRSTRRLMRYALTHLTLFFSKKIQLNFPIRPL